MSPSLTTHVHPSPMGAATTGTDRPYPKVIYDMYVDPWTDAVKVSLDIGCAEDEDFSDQEQYNLEHDKFHEWLDDNHKLDGCDETHTCDRGHYESRGGSFQLGYHDYLRELDKQDVIDFMKQTKIIPDYVVSI
jgi:hypothetical protein